MKRVVLATGRAGRGVLCAHSVVRDPAGGIEAGNVRDAIETMRPFAVDLSASVESAPGVLDFDRLYDFFEAYRAVVEAG